MRGPVEVFDVVVVGGGGAGLAAAIEARAAGGSVLLLEKNPQLGGSTAWSVGSVTSSATPHQLRRGIDDCPADHFADMLGFAGALQPRDNDALRRILCEELPATFQWLLDSGVRFYGPMPEPPHRKPRMHNVLPNSLSFPYHLGRRARRAGVEIRLRTRVTGLTREGDRVAGVEALGRQGPQTLRAKGGVVLAAGDFTAGTELKARFMGEREAKVEAVNSTATGDGQILALDCGARILNGDLALGPEIRFIAPERSSLARRLPPWTVLADFMAWSLDHLPQKLLRPFVMSFITTALAPSPDLFREGAILVNRRGERFADELEAPAFALAEQDGKQGFILLDRRLAAQFSGWPHFVSTAPGVAYAYLADYQRNRPDVYAEASGLDALSERLGMPLGSLSETVARYNSGSGGRPLLESGPYVALGPVRPVFVHNEGGVAVDGQHRVLDAADRPIPGLYAAGSTGQGGLLLKGHGHHLAWAFVSGRRAGRFAAIEVMATATRS
jgi:succinate dehydrogenase/fumarate reductase flavoprotein subunit